MKRGKLIIISSVLLAIIGLTAWAGNNINLIIRVADGFDNNSKTYYRLVERVYAIISNNADNSRIVFGSLEKVKNNSNVDLRVQILGVAGYANAASTMLEIYSDYHDDPNRLSTLFYIINSLGIIDNREVVPILEAFLEKHDENHAQVSKSAIARSLYLATGNLYKYIGNSGKMTSITLTDELKHAREIIVNSKGRLRAFEEMANLDKLFRKPE